MKCLAYRATAFLLLFSWSAFLLADDYYIRTQGDFDTHARAVFQPGDRILLERGAVFNGMLAPRGIGSPDNVIKITTFGTGKRPQIHNNGVIYPVGSTDAAIEVSAGIFLCNTDYWEVEGLEVTNNNGTDQEEHNLIGIYVLAEDTGRTHNHIYIRDCHVHHVNGAVEGKLRGGIHVHANSPESGKHPRYNDLRIVGNRIEHVGGVGIGNKGDSSGVGADKAVYHTDPANRVNAWTNVYVANNYVAYTGRNGIIARDSDDAVYEYNTLAHNGQYSYGHSLFCFNTLGIKIQYNEAYGNVGDDGMDRGGFDADYNCRDTYIQYNYSHDNMWFCGIMKRPNKNVYIRHNLSVNEKSGAYFYGFDSQSSAENIQIYNNTHYFSRDIVPKIIVENRTPINTVFKNNIFYCEGSGEWGDEAENGDNVKFENNLYFNLPPHSTDSRAILRDPQFIAPGDAFENIDMRTRDALNGYRLRGTSPAVDAGFDTSYDYAKDLWGRSFPNGPPDVGAGEWYDEPIRDYESWSRDQKLDGTRAEPDSDSDQDGIKNLLEYAMGLNPRAPDKRVLTVASINSDRCTFSMPKAAYTAGIKLQVSQSHDLVQWMPISEIPTRSELEDGKYLLTFENLSHYERRSFFRVEVLKRDESLLRKQ